MATMSEPTPNRYQVAARVAADLFHGGPRQDYAKELIADALGTAEDAARAEGAEERDKLKEKLQDARYDARCYRAADEHSVEAANIWQGRAEKADAALAEARREALEQAAQRVDDWYTVHFSKSPGQKVIDEIKEAIRALAEPAPAQPEEPTITDHEFEECWCKFLTESCRRGLCHRTNCYQPRERHAKPEDRGTVRTEWAGEEMRTVYTPPKFEPSPEPEAPALPLGHEHCPTCGHSKSRHTGEGCQFVDSDGLCLCLRVWSAAAHTAAAPHEEPK